MHRRSAHDGQTAPARKLCKIADRWARHVREVMSVLADSYGRVATDLRVSLTDRCNLRCSYCMPPEGLEWLPKPSLLTDDEVVRLARIGVQRLGITEIRYTGGEPLPRPRLADIAPPTPTPRPTPQISPPPHRHPPPPRPQALPTAGLDTAHVSR